MEKLKNPLLIELRDSERRSSKKALPLLFKRETVKEKNVKIMINLKRKKEGKSKKEKSKWSKFIKLKHKNLR